MHSQTIAALSTATPAALGVIRLSGPQAKEAVSALFSPAGGGDFTDYPPRKLIYGQFKDKDGHLLDQVLATYSNGPASYTGEDTAEVHCHGAPLVLAMALEALFAQGCRQAQAGEFTQRSFLNGKLDLAQAEGVADLLEATCPGAVHLAVNQLSGALSLKIEGIYQEFSQLMAHFCAVLDYPDEDIDPFGAETMVTTLKDQERALTQLAESWQRGKRITQGVPCALVGLPNAGKSSLLNALLGYERAIVTPIPGTTRDTIEAPISLGQLSLRLIDTAGLRDSSDPIEQLGVARSREALEQAALILVVIDGSQGLTGQEPVAPQGIPCICVLTKSDKTQAISGKDLPFTHVCHVCSKSGEGLKDLENMITSLFITDSIHSQEPLLSNLRQVEQVHQALSHVKGALEALDSGMPPDAVLTDVEGAMEALGRLTGKSVSQDITQEIFTRFCVGK